MPMRVNRWIAVALLLVLLASLGAWFLFKHVRIVAPELNGVTCRGAVCVDDMSLLSRAAQLHRDAMLQVAAKLSPLTAPPRTVFCSTRACYHAFGGGMERGATILDLGIILPPDSWVAHIVEHEFIHMLQAQELGLFGRQSTPDWFKEGMPFFISDPPAHDLPEYAKPLVAQYKAWEGRVGRQNVWREANRRWCLTSSVERCLRMNDAFR